MASAALKAPDNSNRGNTGKRLSCWAIAEGKVDEKLKSPIWLPQGEAAEACPISDRLGDTPCNASPVSTLDTAAEWLPALARFPA
jgi:hypothetical protein